MTQADATRIGICLNDYEQFWWRADTEPTCPVCNTDDEDYEETHRFFVAERRPQGEDVQTTRGTEAS